MDIPSPSLIATLANWAAIGRRLRPPIMAIEETWASARRLIKVARAKLDVEAEHLRELFRYSDARLSPLEDPLKANLGAHRWLRGDREETYSDWLQWVIEQLGSPDLVYSILGEPPPEGWQNWGTQLPDVRREVSVQSGHEGHEGRLDIVVRYGMDAIIVVEVKVGNAEAADTIKQTGYALALDSEHESVRVRKILLATSAQEREYYGFTFWSWASVCVVLRKKVPELHRLPLVTRAMLLAFVGAVEQNLLGFSSSWLLPVLRGEASLQNAGIVDHLERVCGD